MKTVHKNNNTMIAQTSPRTLEKADDINSFTPLPISQYLEDSS